MKKLPPALFTALLVFTTANAQTVTGVATWQGNGDWHTDTNWDPGVPGPAATANFHKAGATTVTATNNLSVAVAMVNAGDFTFNLGGHSLLVGGRFDVGGNIAATPGFSAANNTSLKITSGAVNVGANDIRIGEANCNNNSITLEGTGALIANWAYLGLYDSRTDNKLIVSGPNTRLDVKNIQVGSIRRAHDSKLILQDCAVTNTLVRIGNTEAQRCSVTLERAELVTGNVNVGFNGWGGEASFLNVLDGSTLNISGSLSTETGADGVNIVVSNSVVNIDTNLRVDRNGNAKNGRLLIHQDPGRKSRVKVTGSADVGYGSHSSRIVINGGALEIVNNLYLGDGGGNGFAVIVTNGVLAVPGQITIGQNTNPRNCRIELTGAESRLETPALIVGHRGYDHRLHINGGTAVITNLNVGYYWNATSLGSNNTLAVSSPTSRLEAGSLGAILNSTLEFSIPDNGFDQTPVYVKGTASLNNDTRIIINAGKFSGPAVLMEADTGTISKLPDENFIFKLRPGTHARRPVIQTGKSIEVEIIRDASIFLLK